MDESVLKALQRWPDVPAAYGWLSLGARGQWRLHPAGDAGQADSGEPITSTQILAFIDRNYESDAQGNWFFQNGPQRVYVHLDAAPFILRRARENGGFETHTGVPVREIRQWHLDSEGRLFAQTEHGAAIVDDRELGQVLTLLQTDAGTALIDLLDQEDDTLDCTIRPSDGSLAAARITYMADPDYATQLGFVRTPVAPPPRQED